MDNSKKKWMMTGVAPMTQETSMFQEYFVAGLSWFIPIKAILGRKVNHNLSNPIPLILNTPIACSQWNVEIPYVLPWFPWGLFSMNGGWDY